MHADLGALQDLIKALSPVERKKLAKSLGMVVRRSAGQRIKKNVDPEGSAFVPRKPQKYSMKKGKMFKRLSQLRRLSIIATDQGVNVQYKSGLDGYIAGVHQFGKSSIVNRKKRLKHKYPVRELFGITNDDQKALEDAVKQHLGF
ncbi:phage virion morphogenesis protein [Wohlfahrtiimonas chitiniclastica]|uniref:phage virion morphogenesis protein n=1 Tax=Wohlfahrtiimonas chitiniclastica TaxID=400946 RepID=UPI001BD0837F|nr:phage virion morphogenesis protein [Wohlfahrtiimonas chitiniclastica]MBS7819049.1 phage virion morphogenesis protein [Wohlfahrtiimonas chitiniclastica]